MNYSIGWLAGSRKEGRWYRRGRAKIGFEEQEGWLFVLSSFFAFSFILLCFLFILFFFLCMFVLLLNVFVNLSRFVWVPHCTYYIRGDVWEGKKAWKKLIFFLLPFPVFASFIFFYVVPHYTVSSSFSSLSYMMARSHFPYLHSFCVLFVCVTLYAI